MVNRQALLLAVLALSHYATADFGLHKFKKAEVAVSGARPAAEVSGPRAVGVSGAALAQPERVTKSDKIKTLLGLSGPVVAPVVPPGCKSAYSYVRGNANFTFLDQAIQATGLVSLLDDPALVATVFAPNDAAFTASLASLLVTPQELFSDVVTLTVILKYHVIPGLSLEFSDFRDSQPYDTLLTDKKGNSYPVIYDLEREIDLAVLKTGGGRSSATTDVYSIIPSGGKAAKITTFDINAGCPTVVHIINRVLIPDYDDALAADAADTAIDALSTYAQANATINLP